MTAESYLKKIETHKGIILKIVNLYADDLEDRKDLYQEIVLQSFSAYHRFQGNAQFSTWLYRISLNVALTYLDKRKKRTNIKTLSIAENYVEPIELSERADFLYRAIKQLAKIDRSMILLHLEGFGNTEISEMMGVTRGNVNVKLHRIKQQLTTLLTKK
jgi:RNA polymerase sigma-70 factor (ECF subfamily)